MTCSSAAPAAITWTAASALDRADYSAAFGAVNVDLMPSARRPTAWAASTPCSASRRSRARAFDDTLFGDWRDNGLLGGMGNDLLRGGEGADYIDGGPGADRIDFDSPWDGVDTVAGFEAVPGGDVIDIADLLQNWTGYAGGAGGPLSSFVRLETIGPDAQLQIDPDGFGPCSGSRSPPCSAARGSRSRLWSPTAISTPAR